MPRSNRIPVKLCNNWVQNNQLNPIQLLEVSYQTTTHLKIQPTTSSLKLLRPCSCQTPISMKFSQTASICNLKNSRNLLLIAFRFQYLLDIRNINKLKTVPRYSQISQICQILQQQLLLQSSMIPTNRRYSSKLSFSSWINKYSIMMSIRFTQILLIINFQALIILITQFSNSILYTLQQTITTTTMLLTRPIICW